jgi:hypothetical protein
MTRLALTAVLATAALCSGCYVDSGDVNLYWAFRRSAPAQASGFIIYDASWDAVSPSGICPEAGVDWVQVDTAVRSLTIECTGPAGGGRYVQGAVLYGLRAGNQRITVTGFRNGTAIFRSDLVIHVLGGDTVDAYVDVQGIPAPLQIDVDLGHGSPPVLYADCAAAGSPDLTVDLWDVLQTPTLIDTHTVSCSGALPATVYPGFDLDLDDYTVRAHGGALQFDTCGHPLGHFTAQSGQGSYQLTALAGAVCP